MQGSKIGTVHTRTHKALFPLLRRLSDGKFHSGETLAQVYGLSRASIFNAIVHAESMGLRIDAVRGRGYRLAQPIDWLAEAEVRRYLGAVAEAYSITVCDSVDSTNSTLLAAALKGAAHGAVVCCEHQYAGKGRRGRPWHSSLGGSLTFSLLWRFDLGLQSLGGLSLAVGLAIARAVNRHSEHPARLKWPNDVLVDHRKLAGILVEVQGDPNGAAFAVVGVGLNVRLTEVHREAVDQAVIDLAEMGVSVSRNELLADCLSELHHVLQQFCAHGFAALRDDWRALDAFSGRAVWLNLPDGRKIEGLAAGVDESGAFLLRGASSSTTAYSGGEISLRLAPPA